MEVFLMPQKKKSEDAQPDDKMAHRIQNRMEELGLSRIELAKKARITPASLSQIMNGKRTPGWRISVKLARALGVSLEFLSGLHELDDLKLVAQDDDIKELLRHYLAVPQNQKEQIINFAKFLASQNTSKS
jgi:transcriptional regulator with XRE-family HTH domain